MKQSSEGGARGKLGLESRALGERRSGRGRARRMGWAALESSPHRHRQTDQTDPSSSLGGPINKVLFTNMDGESSRRPPLI